MYISIPSGDFEVAKACSGLKFVIAGLMLGTLYSFLTYSSWRKRLLSMAAFLVHTNPAERTARVHHHRCVAL